MVRYILKGVAGASFAQETGTEMARLFSVSCIVLSCETAIINHPYTETAAGIIIISLEIAVACWSGQTCCIGVRGTLVGGGSQGFIIS